MITNTQFIQTTSYLFAIAIAMALSVLAFVKDTLTLLTFRASTAAPEYPRIAVTVKVEVVTTQYSMSEPSSCVTYDSSTMVKLSSECYSNARPGKRNRVWSRFSGVLEGTAYPNKHIVGSEDEACIFTSKMERTPIGRRGRRKHYIP
ncbi:hypothetical protein IW261DRAFT_1641210 [Armillaria novae-zelandiae]|uniref:Uncharacterized protein n=1 Tax=Armillaria novae-zelandiae TaxID=153914 RepID=A0AA39PRP1_9AGAR|nr:hypothetical protein IW261DRAFT_1641210 [Armillaria novae-zelandiae]